MFLLKASEFSFINHDSVLKLNDIRTVSINRILYQQNGMIDPVSNTYKQIEQLVLQKYFPSFYYDYNHFQQKAFLLEKQLIIPGLSEPPVRTLRATIPENESHIFR